MAPVHGLPPGPPIPGALQGLIAGVGLLRGGGLDGPLFRRLHARYGDLFTIQSPLGTAVVVGHPDLVKQVFRADAYTLHAGEGSPLASVLGPNSLLAIDEERHMEQRKLLLPPFHGERMHAYEAIVEEETLREIDSWPVGRPLRTLEPMMRITLNVILRAVLGVRDGPLMQELQQVMPETVKLGSRMAGLGRLQRDLGPHSPWGRFVRLRRRFDWGVNTLVDQARNDPDGEARTDVLSMLALARHEDDGSLMTDAEIADQLTTVLAAGHETTATTLAWTVERLRRHPHVLQRLEREDDELRQATIYEIQRTRPVIPGAGRLVMKPFELGDYVIPADTVLLLAGPILHNNPEIYPDPERFDPDRFLGKRPSPYAWVPFGGGIRRCPGAAFANMEMDIVLRTLLRELELEVTTEPPERSHFRGVAFAPGDGGVAVVHHREHAAEPRAAHLRAVA
jgi:cytochrome P450